MATATPQYLKGYATYYNVEFDLRSHIGTGASASVYKAVRRATGQLVAFKKVKHSPSVPVSRITRQDTGYIQGWVDGLAADNEIAMMERLQHPHICKIYESFVEKEYIILVLEYVNGGDLENIIAGPNLLTDDAIRTILHQICQAMAYVHSQGIVHLDLKPANILVCSGEPLNIKITDFGISKVMQGSGLLHTGCGTEGYRAPELYGGKYDYKVDSWSTGVIAFNLLTRMMPYTPDPRCRPVLPKEWIEWKHLSDCRASENATSFVHQLLVPNPKKRWSLTEALLHPWLREANGLSLPAADIPPFNAPSDIDEDEVEVKMEVEIAEIPCCTAEPRAPSMIPSGPINSIQNAPSTILLGPVESIHDAPITMPSSSRRPVEYVPDAPNAINSLALSLSHMHIPIPQASSSGPPQALELPGALGKENENTAVEDMDYLSDVSEEESMSETDSADSDYDPGHRRKTQKKKVVRKKLQASTKWRAMKARVGSASQLQKLRPRASSSRMRKQ